MNKLFNKNVLSYILGTIISTLGIAIGVKANYGLSMIAATPYIYAKYFVNYFPWITQGKAEYIWNLVIIAIMAIIVKKWKWSYLLAFVTSFFVGNFIDAWLFILRPDVFVDPTSQIVFFVIGTLLTSIGIAFYFKTTLPQQAYELCVVEISNKYNIEIHKVKMFYDYLTLVFDVILSLVLFKGFVGIGIGTILITLFNSRIIKLFSNILDKLGY